VDYDKYLFFLSKYSREKEVAVLAYCVMANHIHFLVRPSDDRGLAKMMQGVILSP
jgi:REP element-mobilizing transposase RayT